MKRSTLAYILLFSFATLNAAIPDVSPAPNATHADPAEPIIINFADLDINQLTLNNDNIKIYGSETTYAFTTIDYTPSTHRLTMRADKDFRPGEQITVIVTNKVKTTSFFSRINPFLWTFTVAPAKGSFDFYREDIQRIGKTFSFVEAGDLDADQDADLVTVLTNSSKIGMLRNNGHGSFAAEPVSGSAFYMQSTLADFDSDGDLDFVTSAKDINSNSGLQFFTNKQGILEIAGSFGMDNFLRCMIALDFDLDGDLDLAVTVQGSEKLLLLKNYKGIFSQNQELAGFYRPQSITAGDFDNDGVAELIVLDYSRSTFSFFENDGAGRFSLDYILTVAESPYYCSNGDLNHDGYSDLVISHYSSSKVSVYFNQGNKQFKHIQTIDVGQSPRFLRIADINADGYLDLLVPCYDGVSLDIIKNQGGTSFSLLKSIPLPKVSAHLATTDIDNDGDIDIAVAATDYSPTVSDLILLRTMESAPDIILDSYTLDFGTVSPEDTKDITIQVKNISLQSTLELVNISSSNTAFKVPLHSFSLASGQSFELKVSFKPQQTKNYLDSLVLITNDPDQPEVVVNLTGTGDNQFYPLPNAPAARENVHITMNVNEKLDPRTLQTSAIKLCGAQSGLHTFEVDYEENQGLLTIYSDRQFKFGEHVSITLTDRIKNILGQAIQPFSWSFDVRALNGNGRFLPLQAIDPDNLHNWPWLESTEIADLNGDGLLDIISVSDWGLIEMHINNGERTWENSGRITTKRSNLVKCIDIDNDFDIDIILGTADHLLTNKISILKNDGQAHFTVTDSIVTNYQYGLNLLFTDDFNNDGWPDFAIKKTYDPVIHFYKNNAGLGFVKNDTLRLGGYGMLHSCRDFDSDGDNDLIYFEDLELFFLENINGHFVIKNRIETYFRPHHISIADFNKDGHIDIAVLGTEFDDNVLRIFFNNGSGEFTATDVWFYWNLFKASGLVHGDWDSDGDIDFAITGNQTYSGNQSFMLLANNGDGSFTPTHTSYPAKFIKVTQAADFDNNGNMDLLMIVTDEERHRLRIMFGEEEITGIRDDSPLAGYFKLYQNYPNPFNPETIINYELPARFAGGTNFVKLTILDITGREVATLVNKEQSAGAYSVTFNAVSLASGVYFYHIRAGSYSATKKMLLLR